MLSWREVRRWLWLALLIGGSAALIGVVLQNLDRLRNDRPTTVGIVVGSPTPRARAPVCERRRAEVSLDDRQGRSHEWLESTSTR